jgi:hypothetical protein
MSIPSQKGSRIRPIHRPNPPLIAGVPEEGAEVVHVPALALAALALVLAVDANQEIQDVFPLNPLD